MSSLYSRSKDLSSRSRKSLSDSPPSSPSYSTKTFRQDRASSRSDSSGVESPSDRLSARTSTYTRRENRLASLSKTEDDSASKDYKKLYEDALTENEKLKSRLEDGKQELTKIRSQLDRVTQRQDRISERSTVFESEKREKEVLEKRVSDMEEELKTFPALARLQALRRGNARLLQENQAMLRSLACLTQTASLPETDDL
ncbi:protein phosphatase 1 regulatory subunit 12A isoform X1 [Sinocyclocheilus anshuiensis]|uniref:protein phosphatase 1 regulatory subunit 12A isoform X1 n=1 Tax=Sinocyclocheilus anshuiensis TaxID=1608454 RepID=UPI0007B7EC2D|nr:PREDICTED: protein phosphatase 1 regulatory subunit 12A-like isoform X1 [Sinocyclocheilus anshuiensis]